MMPPLCIPNTMDVDGFEKCTNLKEYLCPWIFQKKIVADLVIVFLGRRRMNRYIF